MLRYERMLLAERLSVVFIGVGVLVRLPLLRVKGEERKRDAKVEGCVAGDLRLKEML